MLLCFHEEIVALLWPDVRVLWGKDLETWHESFDVATTDLSVDGRVIVHVCFGYNIVTFKLSLVSPSLEGERMLLQV
jgi:hypothetical protein